MFLLLQDGGIVRARNRVVIGSANTATLRLDGAGIEPQHAELFRDEARVWWLRNVAGRGMLANGRPVPPDAPVRVEQPFEIQLAHHSILAREQMPDGAIAQRLRAKTFEVEHRLHKAVLDEVGPQGLLDASKTARAKIERELDRQLHEIELDAELQNYLATQALVALLMDRVHGYSGRSQGKTRGAALEPRFAGLADRCAQLLHLDDDRNSAERTERIEVLLPWINQQHRDLVSQTDRLALALRLLRQQLIDMMFGLGPLEDLLRATDVNDIMVLPTGQIFIERNGAMQDSGRRMLSPDVSRRIVERIVRDEGRRIDQSSPMVDARIADGSRLNAIIEPIAVNGPTLTIRRFSDKRLTMADLVALESVTDAAAAFLGAAVVARKSIVISGGTGSGKTTLLNALACYIPPSERIITVEDTAEIRLPQAHVVTLQARPPNLEGESAVTIRQLVRNTLRMRPDRILVGECRGGEALDMLQAMNTGHDGSMTTIHANSPWDGVRRLEVLALEAEGINLPSRAVREQIVTAVDLIVQISRLSHRARGVTSICEIVGIDEETGEILVEEIYTLRRPKAGALFAKPYLRFTGHVPTFFDELLRAGVADTTCLR